MAKEKSEAERGESIITSTTQKTSMGEIDTMTVAPRGETIVDIGDDDGTGVQIADKVEGRQQEPPPADDGDEGEGNRNILDDVGQKKKGKPYNKTRDGRIAELTRRNSVAENEKAALLAELEELRGGKQDLEREKKKSDFAAVQHYADNLVLKRKEAQREHKEALDAGDTEKASQAAALMADLAAKQSQVDEWKANNPDPMKEPAGERQEPQRQTQAQPPPQRPPETTAWIAANPWFDRSKPEFDAGMQEEATAFAQLLEARLKRAGNAQAIGSRDYFNLIDRHMQETFGGADEGSEEEEAPPQRGAPPRMTPGSGVAPVRSNATGRAGDDPPANPNSIRLSPEQREVAHALILKHPNGQSYTTREKEVAYAKGLRLNRKGA